MLCSLTLGTSVPLHSGMFCFPGFLEIKFHLPMVPAGLVVWSTWSPSCACHISSVPYSIFWDCIPHKLLTLKYLSRALLVGKPKLRCQIGISTLTCPKSCSRSLPQISTHFSHGLACLSKWGILPGTGGQNLDTYLFLTPHTQLVSRSTFKIHPLVFCPKPALWHSITFNILNLSPDS